jgi:hypothetical protein
MAPRALMAQITGRGMRPGTLFPRTIRRGRTGRRRQARSSRRRGSFSDATLRERLSRSWCAPRLSLALLALLSLFFVPTIPAHELPAHELGAHSGSRPAVPSMRAARLSGVGRGRRRCGICGRSMRGCGRGARRQTRSGARVPGGSWPRRASALGAIHSFLFPDVAAVARRCRRCSLHRAAEPRRAAVRAGPLHPVPRNLRGRPGALAVRTPTPILPSVSPTHFLHAASICAHEHYCKGSKSVQFTPRALRPAA